MISFLQVPRKGNDNQIKFVPIRHVLNLLVEFLSVCYIPRALPTFTFVFSKFKVLEIIVSVFSGRTQRFMVINQYIKGVNLSDSTRTQNGIPAALNPGLSRLRIRIPTTSRNWVMHKIIFKDSIEKNSYSRRKFIVQILCCIVRFQLLCLRSYIIQRCADLKNHYEIQFSCCITKTCPRNIQL